jgi:hypothetical protein
VPTPVRIVAIRGTEHLMGLAFTPTTSMAVPCAHGVATGYKPVCCEPQVHVAGRR